MSGSATNESSTKQQNSNKIDSYSREYFFLLKTTTTTSTNSTDEIRDACKTTGAW